MFTPRCINLVTICACEVPAAFSFMTNSRTCSSDMEDCAVRVSGHSMSSRIYRMTFFILWIKSLFLFLLLTRFSLICCKDSDIYFYLIIFLSLLLELSLVEDSHHRTFLTSNPYTSIGLKLHRSGVLRSRTNPTRACGQAPCRCICRAVLRRLYFRPSVHRKRNNGSSVLPCHLLYYHAIVAQVVFQELMVHGWVTT